MGVREDITSYCYDAIGCDYDYTPSSGYEGESYNCSFLTYCAYKSAGISIPYWQGHQNGEGSQSDWVRWNGNWTTNPDYLMPGDLVFFGSSPFYTTHVGVSLGGWWMIDSVPDGGVRKRTLYNSFVGGGWPMDWTPDEHKPEPKPVVIKEDGMSAIATIVDAGVAVYISDDMVHDLTHPDNITLLDKVWAAGHDGKQMPRVQLTADELGRLNQGLSAGFPVSLNRYADKFKPRS